MLALPLFGLGQFRRQRRNQCILGVGVRRSNRGMRARGSRDFVSWISVERELNDRIYKAVVAGLLFTAWGVLVFLGMAPVNDFVNALQMALVGLGVYHVTLTNPKE